MPTSLTLFGSVLLLLGGVVVFLWILLRGRLLGPTVAS